MLLKWGFFIFGLFETSKLFVLHRIWSMLLLRSCTGSSQRLRVLIASNHDFIDALCEKIRRVEFMSRSTDKVRCLEALDSLLRTFVRYWVCRHGNEQTCTLARWLLWCPHTLSSRPCDRYLGQMHHILRSISPSGAGLQYSICICGFYVVRSFISFFIVAHIIYSLIMSVDLKDFESLFVVHTFLLCLVNIYCSFLHCSKQSHSGWKLRVHRRRFSNASITSACICAFCTCSGVLQSLIIQCIIWPP